MIEIQTTHIPPSLNACYRNVRGVGRVKTARYKTWCQAAGHDFNGKGAVHGAFVVTITIDRQTRHVLTDIDNRAKVVLDLLQTHQIIDNDRYCESATIRWGEAKGGMTVVVEPYTEAQAA